MSRPTPQFSVIVPTCSRLATLAEGLQRLAPGAQSLEAEAYEVVVSDDGSETAERMIAERFPWARWTPGPRRGPAANRNHGAAQAAGAWLAFIDDDCLASPQWLAAFAAAASRGADRVLEGRTLGAGERRSIDMEAPLNADGGLLWSCNFAIQRALFAELGGFDAGFPGPSMEDVELRTRLRKRGIAFPFVPEALVHHPWRRRKGARFLRVYVESVDYFVRQHPEQADLFSFRLSLRILVAGTWRNVREAFRSCGGRGIPRMVWLELCTFGLLARRALGGRRRS